MRTLFVYLLALALVTLAFGACGGSGGDAPPPPPPVTVLGGSWLGVSEEIIGQLDTVRVDVDANGNITDLVVNGQSIGLTGVLQPVQGDVYRMVLSDGTLVGFFTDATRTYATFVDEDGTVGVLQRGAAALPTYANDDVRGATWSGGSVWLDANYGLDTVVPSTADIAADGSFTGSEGGQPFLSAAGAEVTVTHPNLGRYVGGFQVGMGIGMVQLYLSADKQYLGGIAYGGGTFPVDGSFLVWTRQ